MHTSHAPLSAVAATVGSLQDTPATTPFSKTSYSMPPLYTSPSPVQHNSSFIMPSFLSKDMDLAFMEKPTEGSFPPLKSFTLSPDLSSEAQSPRSTATRSPCIASYRPEPNHNILLLDPFLFRKRSFSDSDDDQTHLSPSPLKRPNFVLPCPTPPPPTVSTAFFEDPLFPPLPPKKKGCSKNQNTKPVPYKFLKSDRTYKLNKQLTAATIKSLLNNVYGGSVVVSRKRKSFGEDKNIAAAATAAAITSDLDTCKASNKKRKLSQGRPYSSEMVIDVIFPHTIDELHSFLCVKGPPPISHRVTLKSTTTKDHSTLSPFPPIDHKGNLYFTNSLDMIQYFTGASSFSIVTAFRQSSVDRSPLKKGTCPVVKFIISPVTDFTIGYLKRIAYPRYKACMKIYIIPHHQPPPPPPQKVTTATTSTPGAGSYTYYTSAAMFLQDQQSRIEQGMALDYDARVFSSPTYPDIPGIIYDHEIYDCGADTKTNLNYILN